MQIKIHCNLVFGGQLFVIPCEPSELLYYALSDIREEAIAMARANPDCEVHWSLEKGVFIV